MIPADLLDKLREKDPELWGKIARGIPLKPCGKFMTYDHSETVAHQYQDVYIPFGELLPEVAFAWLQHCLQEAIRARGWSYRLIWASSVDICKAFICTGPGIHESVNCDTEAEALLRAYLAAIQTEDKT